MTAINTAINQTEYNRPTDSRDVDTVLGLLPFLKAAWSFFPIKYVNRTYFDQPETFWTPLIDAVNKTSLRRGLLHGYEVGGPRENKYLFINFIDYILSLAKRLKVTDPLTLANFINTGETSLFTDGILPTYFKIIEVEDRGEKKNEYEALPPDNIDLLRGRLFARMYTKFLTDEAGGLKPGFDHYFHLKAKNIKTALGELIWQLKLPLIGAGELYQLSVQAQSGETITLQQAVHAKMMDSLRGQYNGQQMAQLVICWPLY